MTHLVRIDSDLDEKSLLAYIGAKLYPDKASSIAVGKPSFLRTDAVSVNGYKLTVSEPK